MEIKCIKKEKIEYPTINEISNKKLKSCIPNKWMKLGISSLLFEFIIRNKVFATKYSDIIEMVDKANPVVAGGVEGVLPAYIKAGCNIVTLISALAFIISSIMMIIKKFKVKKQGENTKVSKKIKIVFIISTISLILSRIGFLIVKII